jgi:hypothetical protein
MLWRHLGGVACLVLALSAVSPAIAATFDPQDGAKRAAAGDAKAQDALGRYYFEGTAGAPDYDQALKWTQQAAAKGIPSAMTRLGVMLINGLGVAEADADQATELWKKAARLGDPEAMALMAATLRAQGEAGSDAEALKWFRQAAQKGHARAQYQLGELLSRGWGAPTNVAQARTWWLKAAQQGVAEAYTALGASYQEQDSTQALRYTRLGAEGGHPQAMGVLGQALLLNEQPGDDAEGWRWLRRAVGLGDRDAFVVLGKLLTGQCPHEPGHYHLDHECVPATLARNDAEGARLVLAAAEMGMFESYLAAARLYREGRGVPKDARKTYQWSVRAITADQYGDQAALMIFDGPSDVVQTIPAEERLQWDKTAFSGGVMLAGLRIAEAYEQGLGIPRDPLEAAYWYSLVVAKTPFQSKRYEAQEGLKRLAPLLTPAQHATLRRRMLVENLYYY